MLTKNGKILQDSYSSSYPLSPFKSYNGTEISGFSTQSFPYLLSLCGGNITSSYISFAKSLSEVNYQKLTIHAGFRESTPTPDTLDGVFSELSFSYTGSNYNYSVIVVTNNTQNAITINEIDISASKESIQTVNNTALFAVYPIDEVTLNPGESISFSFLHE